MDMVEPRHATYIGAFGAGRETRPGAIRTAQDPRVRTNTRIWKIRSSTTGYPFIRPEARWAGYK